MYKFHATRQELEQAERAARDGLLQAARQAGLPETWETVEPGIADFSRPVPRVSASSRSRRWPTSACGEGKQKRQERCCRRSGNCRARTGSAMKWSWPCSTAA
ncbi:hypothetical protein [Niveibacterium sp. SC-1]|uniref:hypothetical protein n=1 Tax=Niveibacterium sp. SC-1 TaxID=3135646 RepID=UPI00311DC441